MSVKYYLKREDAASDLNKLLTDRQ